MTRNFKFMKAIITQRINTFLAKHYKLKIRVWSIRYGSCVVPCLLLYLFYVLDNHAFISFQKNDYIEDMVLSGNQFDNVAGIFIGKALGKYM